MPADVAHTGRLLIAIVVVGASGILVSLRRSSDHSRRLPIVAGIGLALLCWLALAYAGISLLVTILVLAVAGILVSLIRSGDHPRRLPIVAEIGLVVLCWLAVTYAGLNLLACGLGEDEALGRIRVCYSTSAANLYAAAVSAAAVIPLITVGISHVLGRRRIALIGGLISLGVVTAAVIWGLKTGVRAR